MKDRSNDPSRYERTLYHGALSRYIDTQKTDILNKKVYIVLNYLFIEIYLKDNSIIAANSGISKFYILVNIKRTVVLVHHRRRKRRTLPPPPTIKLDCFIICLYRSIHRNVNRRPLKKGQVYTVISLYLFKYK